MDNKTKLYKIGIIFGAFDMFHIGQLNILRASKGLCDRLIVSVASDEYIEEKHGYKVIMPLSHRFKIIMACSYVDDIYVHSNDEDKLKIVQEQSPDIIIIGDSKKLRFDKDKMYNLPVVYLPYERGVSLKLLRKRLKGEK